MSILFNPVMAKATIQAVVAGHLCLDIIPGIESGAETLDALMAPGKLLVVGPMRMAAGGAVANTGGALARLGVPVRLVGKVGADAFGREVERLLKTPGARVRLLVSETEATSYTLVLNPPRMDRCFLHCPGANDAFDAAEVADALPRGARLFHFGYPQLMRGIYADGGRSLERLLRAARGLGMTTSLDTAMADPESEAGRVDWRDLLRRVLPQVDCFMPSADELAAMLRPDHAPEESDGAVTAAMADELLAMGAALVLIKQGALGAYLRTTDSTERWRAAGRGVPRAGAVWRGRELAVPCFAVRVAGTTGAGDTTIAGFLAAMLRGLPPEQALLQGAAVGACSVEGPDALSAIPALEGMEARLSKGWKQVSRPAPGPSWTWRRQIQAGLWHSPRDARP